ncbi:ricin-type beta-trefoil lectin domain protein [Streptomyces hydrogenans]|uniref:ricin-type beta-trefoil lectin domain protein n=1 Tax=Streptomyces hydrogenans TaxID=1873719 RepID=UPI0035E21EBE
MHPRTVRTPGRRSSRLQRAWSPLAAALVASALTLVTVPPAAGAADDGPSPRQPSGGGVSAPAATPEQRAALAARAEAKRTGRAVVVDALTTDRSRTLANPDGTLTTTDHARAVRAKRGKAWADLDTTLARNADGSISPRVTSNSLTVSGGGSGPLASIATSDGTRLDVSAPFPLPAPTLDGDTAVYAEVLPDVDLRITALPDGGWRDVIVVRTAEAAADPRLRKLHFPVSAQGLKLSTDSKGNLSVKDGKGRTRMQAPTPFQWDSSAPSAETGRKDAKAPGQRSTADMPGDRATVSKVGIRTTAGGFDLVPDLATLGKGRGPWYIDPTISAESKANGSVQVQENHPETQNYNAIGELGTGYCGYSDCTGYGRYRAYFRIGVNPLIHTQPNGAPYPPTVYGSTLHAQVKAASSPGTDVPLGLYWTGAINQWTRWNAQPCGTGGHMQGCSKIGDSDRIVGTGPISFDVSWHMQRAAAEKWSDFTVAIAPDNEYEKLYRKRIASDPFIETRYDIAPSVWAPHTTPAPGFARTNTYAGCNIAGQRPEDAGWVGNNQSISLTAANWSPANFNLYTAFTLLDGTDNSKNQTLGTWSSSWNPNGVTVSAGSLTDGHWYGYNVIAYDDPGNGGLASPQTERCYFRVDRTSPSVAVTSTDFPPSGTPNPNPTKYSHQKGAFTLTGQDPAPSTGPNRSGVACFRVSTSPTPVTGWKCGDSGTLLADGDGRAVHEAVPGTWGTNLLYVQAQDNAGNYSQPAVYTYYAPAQPGLLPVFGDTNGDRTADLVLPDARGNLRTVGGNTDPDTAASAGAAAAPGNDQTHKTTWNDYDITHRGTLDRAARVDQLIVHNTSHADLKEVLYLIENDGHGNFGEAASRPLDRPTDCSLALGAPAETCPESHNATWSDVTQISAIGTPEGEVTQEGQKPTATSALTVEKGELWLHRPSTVFAGQFGSSHLIPRAAGAGSWDDYELINPGPANGPTSTAGGTVRQATVWSRHRATGTIRAYPITGGTATDYTSLTDPAGGRVLGTVDTAAYPEVGSVGDLDGDQVADLWARTAAGEITVLRGVSDPSVAGRVVSLSSATEQGDALGAVLRLPLTGAADGRTPDLVGPSATAKTGLHPGTLSASGVSFVGDTVGGRATTVAAFKRDKQDERNSGSLVAAPAPTTTEQAIDTTRSFTISAWANPSLDDGGVVASQDGLRASGFVLWPDMFQKRWRFAMARTDDDSWPYDMTDLGSTDAAVFQVGRWDRLTASYNADSGLMSLYVNGVLAGTGLHTQKSGITGPLVLGRYKLAGAPSAAFTGKISDVTVQARPTDPWSGASGPIAFSRGGKCADNHAGGTSPSNPIVIWDCNGSTPQLWSYDASKKALKVMGGCLDVTGGATAAGSTLGYYACNGSPAQQFIPMADGSVLHPASNRCLDLPWADTTNGTRLQIYDCNGTLAQKWSVTTRG